MIKRKKKRKDKVDLHKNFQGNATVLGYNTDVLIVLKGFFSIQNVSKHFFRSIFDNSQKMKKL